MIGIPIFLWLLFTSFNFDNIDQLFAVLAVHVVDNLYKSYQNENFKSVDPTPF